MVRVANSFSIYPLSDVSYELPGAVRVGLLTRYPEIPSLSLMELSTSDPGRSNAETSPIVDQFENRKDESSRECPDADDSSAEIYVSDDCIEFLIGVSAVIFGRHGPNYLST